MFESIRNAFSIPDLRKKLLFTLWMLVFYRVGAHVPTPFIDTTALNDYFNNLAQTGAGNVFGFVDMFTGGAFSQMTVMALGVMPYISASIIMQVMNLVIPQLQKMSKEGEAGRRKINQVTRYGATALAAFQSAGLGLWMLNEGLVVSFMANNPFLFLLTTVISLTTGCTILMWVGERITDRGIGNGMSILIAASIVVRYFTDAAMGIGLVRAGEKSAFMLLMIVALMVVSTIAIILVQEGARKVPIQHAKRQVGGGKRVEMGQMNFLPLKVNTAGVIPVIFASALLSLPTTLFSFIGAGEQAGAGFAEWFAMQSRHNLYNWLGLDAGAAWRLLTVVNLHTILYVVLTIFFCFFYTAVVFNPQEVAENLKKVGAYVPGYRPGKETADYIDSVISRITLVGAVFLVVIALIPQVLSISFGVAFNVAELTGGTGLIIVVSVVLDTMKHIESQLLMRHYEGFRMKRAGGGGGARRWSQR